MTRTRRAILLVLLLPVLLLAQGPVRDLTILHVNDLHARLQPDQNGLGGFAYLAAALRKERAGCRHCLLLNAGDLVQGDPVSTIFHGLPVYEIGNRFGFDVSTLGNHEFDYGWQQTRKFLRKAEFPVVSANVVDGSGRLMTRAPYWTATVNGIRVAVIGVAMGDLSTFETPDRMGSWRALPVVQTVRKYAAELKDTSDLIVLLAHVNDREAEEVLRHVPEVSLIVSGHDHTGLKEAETFQGRINVRVNGYGGEYGRLDLRVDVPARRLVAWSWKRVPVDSRALRAAPDVAALVAHWEAKVSKVVDVHVGESRRQLTKPEMKALIETAMREETGADFAFMNLGGVRDVFPSGRLLARNVWNVMPFDNRVVVGRFPGSRLPKVVAAERRLDPDKVYSLAVTDFTAANQGARSQLQSSGLEFPETGPLLRDLLLHWIRIRKIVP